MKTTIDRRSVARLRRPLLSLVLLLSVTLASAAPTRPNILLIMSDDMGFSDLGSYGGEIATPNLDALAKDGVRFSQFYNSARCCPSRAALLTGLHPHQAGFGHMTYDRGHPGYRGDLNRQNVTIAEVLRAAGYRTYLSGKWHLTRFVDPAGDIANWPVQRGFDRFYGLIKGGGSFYDPTSLCRQNTYITPDNDPEYQPETYYLTDAISDQAVRFLREHARQAPAQPFFLYVAYTAAHWPMHALEKDIAKYRGKFAGGFAAVREARVRRLRALGLVDPQWEIPPAKLDWEAVDDKAWEARCMEVYAAMVDNMDQGIGRIVEQLRRDGQWENTLIFFLQDNGGCAEQMGRIPRSGEPPADLRPMGRDELQHQLSPPMQTRDGRWVRTGPGVMPGPADTYIAYGEGWANVSNTPFREYKHWVHEGGISTPLIVHWPAGLPAARRGAWESQPGHLIDIMATCVDVTGAAYPRVFRGEAIKPMEGVSLAPAFAGRTLERKEPLCWEHESTRAIRDGKWKLVSKRDSPWELYDMETDRPETRDLSARYPERVRELSARWRAWAARAEVLPLGTWAGRPVELVD